MKTYMKVTDQAGHASLIGEFSIPKMLKHNSQLPPHMKFKLESIEAEDYLEACEKAGLTPKTKTAKVETSAKSGKQPKA